MVSPEGLKRAVFTMIPGAESRKSNSPAGDRGHPEAAGHAGGPGADELEAAPE